MAGILAINLTIWLIVHAISSSGGETAWTHLRAFLRGTQGADSWKPMEAARTYLATRSDHLYEEIFFTRGVKFQYPVTALLLIGSATRRTLAVVSWVATLATAGLTAAILRDALRQADPTAEQPSTGATVGVYLTAGALALTFYPLVKAFSLGQIQTWVDAVFALLVLSWGRGHRTTGGFLTGCLCLVKPTWALLLVWAVVRRQWRFVFAALSVVAVGTAAAMWRYGSINAFGYAHVLSFLARHGEAFYPNQSFNGLLNRLVRNGSNLEWRDFEFPPEHAGVAAGTTIALAILAALAWYSSEADGRRRNRHRSVPRGTDADDDRTDRVGTPLRRHAADVRRRDAAFTWRPAIGAVDGGGACRQLRDRRQLLASDEPLRDDRLECSPVVHSWPPRSSCWCCCTAPCTQRSPVAQRRRETIAALVLGTLTAIAVFAAFVTLDPRFTDPRFGSDVWFEGDLPRIVDEIGHRWAPHSRAAVHPLFSLVACAGVYALRALGLSTLHAVATLIAGAAALWTMLLFAVLRAVTPTRMEAILFTAVGATTGAAVFWLAVPETYAFGLGDDARGALGRHPFRASPGW